MRPQLIGRKIIGIRHMPADPCAGRNGMTALELDDGTWLWASTDYEGPEKFDISIMASSTRGEDFVLNKDYKVTG